jgi:cyclopropane fatty-acyl-phospholipid synthase-like methyltransferase
LDSIYRDKTYLSNNPGWHEEDAPFKAEMIFKIIKRNGLKPSEICEVGCGSGEILIQLSEKFPEAKLTGYDIAPDALDIARKKESERVKFFQKELNEIPKDQFDLVLTIDVIEHLENYFEFLRNLSQKSSNFIFHIPLDLSVWTLFREQMLIESKERVGHIHNFSEGFIKSILKDCGFEIKDSFFTEPVYIPQNIKERFVNVLRKVLFRIHPILPVKLIGGYSLMVFAVRK